MKDLKVISIEGAVILSENRVKGSIIPKVSAELERDVTIQCDTVVEGAIYARKLEIENGDVEIQGAVYTKLECHVSTSAQGNIIFRKTVATSDSVASYARNCRLMFMADINGKQIKLHNAFVAGSIFADEVVLEDCIVLGGVFGTKSIDLKNCIVGTFNSASVYMEGAISLLLPSGFSSQPIAAAPNSKMYNLGLADLGALYKGAKEMENTGIIEMDIQADEQEARLTEEGDLTVLHCYSVVGKVLAADLIDIDKLDNHFLISATSLGSQTLKTYDLGFDDQGKLAEITPDKVAVFFFDLLHGKISPQAIDGSFSIQEIAQRFS